ncbi:MAG TPA: NUDIX domain-containing protein [Streptosporangiaceae bacterium]
MNPLTAAPCARTFGWSGYPIGHPPFAVSRETWDMGTTALGRMAGDLEEVPVPASGGNWAMAWHRPGEAPPGQAHGANAFCVTQDGEVVLISTDGSRWGWPGGRPERGESWEDTLRREMLEEACAIVTEARLLGFVRSRCLSGPEEGLVLVRSIWRADVTLLPWRPEYEIRFRRVVPAHELAGHLWMEAGAAPIYSRAAREAALALRRVSLPRRGAGRCRNPPGGTAR